MYCDFTPTTPGTTQSVGFQVPVNRTAATSGRSPVLEILKVMFQFPGAPALTANDVVSTCTMVLSTKDHEAVNTQLTTSDVFAFVKCTSEGAFTALGTFMNSTSSVYEFNCSDGAGHGVLVATDTVYAQLQGIAGWATFFKAKILYRVKNVSLTEYIGIVQSQQ